MVWQERVPSVVMITNLVEGKKTKCEQYWPSSGSQDFGPFHVSITHQLTLADYTIRTLSVEVEDTFLKPMTDVATHPLLVMYVKLHIRALINNAKHVALGLGLMPMILPLALREDKGGDSFPLHSLARPRSA